jgi:hypothetical protein
MSLGLGIIYALKYQSKRRRRRTPVTTNLLRSPGDSLRIKIDDMTQDLTIYFSLMPAIPLYFYSVHISESYFGGKPETYFRVLVSALPAFVCLTLLSIKLIKLLNMRRRLRLAYDAELAVGQEINQLMLCGYSVYHDFPAEGFNIDHVVAGPAGVFAVETKGRAKPITGNGKSDAEVVYDGETLRFPGWVERKPMEQATRQSSWLAKWLSSATGEAINVQPVLTLPGWFVRRVSSNGIAVINPKIFPSLLKKKGNGLSDSQIKRIIHQLDQRCRDVEPKAYVREDMGK